MRRFAGLSLLALSLSGVAGCQQMEVDGFWKPFGIEADAAPIVPGRSQIIVHAGDTVYSIAKAHNLAVRDLIEVNHLRAPYSLVVGQRLTVEKTPDQDYVVQKGDTLFGLSRRYSIDVKTLAEANDLHAPYTISVGQRLRVPGGGGDVASQNIAHASSPDTAPKPQRAPAGTVTREPVVLAPPPPPPGASTPVAAPIAPASPRPNAIRHAIDAVSLPEPAKTEPAKTEPAKTETAKHEPLLPPRPLEAKMAAAAPVQAPPKNVLTLPPPANVLTLPPPASAAAPAAPAPAAAPLAAPTTKVTKATSPGAKETPIKESPAKETPVQEASAPEAEDDAAEPAAVKKAASGRLAAVPQPAPRSSSRFAWPVKGKLLSGYGAKPGGLHNDGINIAAQKGTMILAAENGVVAYAGNELRGFGNLLLIRHSDGWVTAYAHSDEMLVKRGEQVKRGQAIAKVGSTGNVPSPQLHFEIRRGTRTVDPMGQLVPPRAAGSASDEVTGDAAPDARPSPG